MLKEYAENNSVYIVTGYTDMRKSIDGLAVIIKAKYHLDPYCKSLFLFCGRRCDRIKRKDKEIAELKEKINKLQNQLDGIVKLIKGKKTKVFLNFFPKNRAISYASMVLSLMQ